MHSISNLFIEANLSIIVILCCHRTFGLSIIVHVSICSVVSNSMGLNLIGCFQGLTLLINKLPVISARTVSSSGSICSSPRASASAILFGFSMSVYPDSTC